LIAKKFLSLREEALDIAIQAQRSILQGENDAVTALRSCLVISKSLSKKKSEQWILKEMRGYYSGDEIPNYRHVKCCPYDQYGRSLNELEQVAITTPIHFLVSCAKSKPGYMDYNGKTKTYLVQHSNLEEVLSAVTDACLIFLSDIISELEYGGIVEYLMEEIRKKTDEKLLQLDSKLNDEAKSLVENLTSTNPADWNKVGLSSRKMLTLLADKVFSAQDKKYTLKNGNLLEVHSQNFVNRLIAFIDQKVSGEEEKLVVSQIKYTESYLQQITKLAQTAVHGSIEKYHANMLTIHTYLIISEILRHLDGPKKIEVEGK